MTQTNTQSVRSDAEAAVNTNRVPTFEEVYAMPYVQDSIRALIDQNVRQYPILASHEDDLRQEMLIYLSKSLPQFDRTKSSLKTFCRMVLKIGLVRARRYYLAQEQRILSYAKPVDKMTEGETNSCVSNPFLDMERRECFDAAFSKLNDQQKIVVQKILDGVPLRDFSKLGICSTWMLYREIIPSLRKVFGIFFEKNPKKPERF